MPCISTRPSPCRWYSGNDVGRDQADPLDAVLFPQQVEEAEGKQPAVDLANPRVVVGQAEGGADHWPSTSATIASSGTIRCRRPSAMCSISPWDMGTNPQVFASERL